MPNIVDGQFPGTSLKSRLAKDPRATARERQTTSSPSPSWKSAITSSRSNVEWKWRDADEKRFVLCSRCAPPAQKPERCLCFIMCCWQWATCTHDLTSLFVGFRLVRRKIYFFSSALCESVCTGFQTLTASISPRFHGDRERGRGMEIQGDRRKRNWRGYVRGRGGRGRSTMIARNSLFPETQLRWCIDWQFSVFRMRLLWIYCTLSLMLINPLQWINLITNFMTVSFCNGMVTMPLDADTKKNSIEIGEWSYYVSTFRVLMYYTMFGIEYSVLWFSCVQYNGYKGEILFSLVLFVEFFQRNSKYKLLFFKYF